MEKKEFKPINTLARTFKFYASNLTNLLKLFLLIAIYAIIFGLAMAVTVAMSISYAEMNQVGIYAYIMPIVIIGLILLGVELMIISKVYIEDIYMGRYEGFRAAIRKCKGRFWRFIGATILVMIIYWIVSIVSGFLIINTIVSTYEEFILSPYRYLISLSIALVLPFVGLVTTIVVIRDKEEGIFKYNMSLAKGNYLKLLFIYLVIMVITNILPIGAEVISYNGAYLILFYSIISFLITPYLLSIPIVLLHDLEDNKK